MTPPSRYVERLAVLPRALAALSEHPAGLRIADLAAELGVSAEQLREDVLAYYRSDLVPFGIVSLRQPVIEFVGPSGEDVEPAQAEVLRVVSDQPERELGVEHLAASELAVLYEAGQSLLALEPDNAELQAALDALRSSLLPVESRPAAGSDDAFARTLAAAVQQRRQVRIVYARAWRPGVTERVVEPYRLVRTRRGWEVDAGPLDEAGMPRTFLVSGIRSVQLLDESFEPPHDLDARIARNRAVTAVELVVPQAARWVVDRFAERVAVLQEDERDVKLRADLLPPVRQRLGLVLVTAGPDAYVMEPAELRDAGRELARELLEYHATYPD